MANLGLQTPKKSSIINATAMSVGAVAGYQGYEMMAQKLPVTKEMNVGILGGSILAMASIKGTGVAKTIAMAVLCGIAVNTGYTALEDYGVLNLIAPVTAIAPVQAEVINAEELNGVYDFGGVEYLQPETVEATYDLM